MSEHGRQWAEHHVAGGYHEQDWGPPPSADCELIGTYQGARETIAVRLVDGVTGVPELEIQWGGEEGAKITVLNEETALLYLIRDGAIEVVPD